MKGHSIRPYLHILPAGRGFQANFGIALAACPTLADNVFVHPDPFARHFQCMADLLNSLHLPDVSPTFALRFITLPAPGAYLSGSTRIALLARVGAPIRTAAERLALDLAQQVSMQLTGAFPDYVWEPLLTEPDFLQFWQPFPWQQMHVVEIVRRQGVANFKTVLPRRPLGFTAGSGPLGAGSDQESLYFVHPFLPRPGGIERLLRILLLYSAPVVFTILLAPTHLTADEEQAMLGEISECELYQPSGSSATGPIQQHRVEMICRLLLNQYHRLQDAPYRLQVSLASPQAVSQSLAEAVGVAISAPVGTVASIQPSTLADLQQGGYDTLIPEDEESLQMFRASAANLEFRPALPTDLPVPFTRLRYLVDANEAVSAFRFPADTGDGLPGVNRVSSPGRPLPKAFLDHTSGALLGTNHYLGSQYPVLLAEVDRRLHTYLVGQTGTGKTTLMKAMILSDMKAGRGLAVIDPHGDLFEELLGLIPKERLQDVIVFDPTNCEFPIGFNLLECKDSEQRNFVVREMRAIMRRLIQDQYQHMSVEYTGPIFYNHMQMNMLLAMSNLSQPGTLLEFYEIFQHRNYWKRWLPLQVEDPMLNNWVNNVLPYMNYTDRSRPQEASFGEYLSSKFIDFIFDPRLRLIFGQRFSTFDFSRIMDEGKILLINLAKGSLGEANAQFLGLVLMAKMQAAIMARSKLPENRRRTFYLYVDEFQSLATENFSVLLSEARKFGVGLVLANQHLNQIPDARIIQAVFGNVGTVISLRVGRVDAEALEPLFLPVFNRNDLANLSNWNACVRTTRGGQTYPPFSLQTIPPAKEPSLEHAAEIRRLSEQVYGRPRREVEAEIANSLRLPEEPSEDSDLRLRFGLG